MDVDTQEQLTHTHKRAWGEEQGKAEERRGAGEARGRQEKSQRGNQSPLAKAKVEDFYQKAN